MGWLILFKIGMLVMIIQVVVKGVNCLVSLVFVYIGYENVMEVKSYLNELKGSFKKKELNLQVFLVICKLKNYGYGFVNFGEFLSLIQFLDFQVLEWCKSQLDNLDKKLVWLIFIVNGLVLELMIWINSVVVINGMILMVLCLLVLKIQIMSK